MKQEVTRGRAGSAPRRRRTAGAEPLQEMSFQYHASVAEAIRAMVKAGEAPSANVFVEEAVKERLRERRRERVCAAYAEAAQDPAFMAEMLETERAFDITIGDGARELGWLTPARYTAGTCFGRTLSRVSGASRRVSAGR